MTLRAQAGAAATSDSTAIGTADNEGARCCLRSVNETQARRTNGCIGGQVRATSVRQMQYGKRAKPVANHTFSPRSARVDALRYGYFLTETARNFPNVSKITDQLRRNDAD